MGMKENLKRGTVELLLLHLLSESDMYGYQLSQELNSRSQGLFQLQEGSMYPTLYRMMDKGLISDYQEKVGKRRTRVYYHLETKGREYFEEIYKEYMGMTQGIRNILFGSKEEGEPNGIF